MGVSRLNRLKKGQITVFIILAILIVAIGTSFFVFKDKIFKSSIPQEFQPVYNSYVSCIEDKLNTGIKLLESQGGYIYLPDFSPGSEYMPFSSQLNFQGVNVPYWYYISGNNIRKEQVPSISEMELQIEDFLEAKLSACDLREYSAGDFEIYEGSPNAKVSIKDSQVVLDLNQDLTIVKGRTVKKS